jgi:hypothetical protein
MKYIDNKKNSDLRHISFFVFLFVGTISYNAIFAKNDNIRSYKLYTPNITSKVIYNGDLPGHNRYNHCPSLEYFEGNFYAVWNTNKVQKEGKKSQIIVCSTSPDFDNWSDPIHFVGRDGNAVNRIENPNGMMMQWQPNLLNYKDQELWCFWYGNDFEDSTKRGFYMSTLAAGATQWSNRMLIYRAICEGHKCVVNCPCQNAVLLSTGRVLVPITLTDIGGYLPWGRSRRYNAVTYTDDGGKSWDISNVITSPENPGAQWEIHVYGQFDGLLRVFYLNYTYKCQSPVDFPVPIPTKLILTCTGIGKDLDEPVLFEPDAHYSHVETVRNRVQTIRLESGRYCMFQCDVYSEMSAYESRQNTALWFSRIGRDDFVAGPGIQPRNEVGFYTQGIEHDGKIYAIYTKGANRTNRGIQGVCIDPVPSGDNFYIWPRSKDLLEMKYVDGIGVRTNSDYKYVKPYLSNMEGRSAIVFEKKGMAGVEIDPIDFSKGECLKFRFATKIDRVQNYFNLILCTFGDKQPIHIGIPGNRKGELYADNGRGWQRCGTLPIGKWQTVEILFSGDYFTVRVAGQKISKLINPVKNPNPRLYLGEGYESDIYDAGATAIRNNDDSKFYIDMGSISSVVEKVDISGNMYEEQDADYV